MDQSSTLFNFCQVHKSTLKKVLKSFSLCSKYTTNAIDSKATYLEQVYMFITIGIKFYKDKIMEINSNSNSYSLQGTVSA